VDTVHECDRQTDRQTDGRTDGRTDSITINKTVQRTASHGKNEANVETPHVVSGDIRFRPMG